MITAKQDDREVTRNSMFFKRVNVPISDTRSNHYDTLGTANDPVLSFETAPVTSIQSSNQVTLRDIPETLACTKEKLHNSSSEKKDSDRQAIPDTESENNHESDNAVTNNNDSTSVRVSKPPNYLEDYVQEICEHYFKHKFVNLLTDNG